MSLLPQPIPAAPPELVQWFHEALDREGREIQLFIDPVTRLEIGVFRNNAAMRERMCPVTVSAPQPRRTPLPSATPCHTDPQPGVASPGSSSSSQAHGSKLDNAGLAQIDWPRADAPQPDQRKRQPLPATGEPALATSTSAGALTRPRRLVRGHADEQPMRVTKRARQESPKDVATPVDLSNTGDSSAGRSLDRPESARPPQDLEAIEAWFREAANGMKFPSPAMQATLIARASAIAGIEAAEDWQQYMASWRMNGHLTSRPTSRGGASTPKHLGMLPASIVEFYHAYSRIGESATTAGFRAISHRCRMVEFWIVYTKAEQAQLGQNIVLRRGQTAQSRRKRFLFDTVHPELAEIKDVEKDAASRSTWRAFSDRLGFASRWYKLQEELGFGILALIPERVVPTYWVEKELNKGQFELWVKTIKHFNPRCKEAACKWKRTLSRAREGKQASQHIHTIEGIRSEDFGSPSDATLAFCDEVELSGDEMTPIPDPLTSELIAYTDVADDPSDIFTIGGEDFFMNPIYTNEQLMSWTAPDIQNHWYNDILPVDYTLDRNYDLS